MQGFLNLRINSGLRNFLTRCLAIIPSLIIALISDSAGAGELIIIASQNQNGLTRQFTSDFICDLDHWWNSSVIKYIWLTCRVEIFGSYRTRMYLPTSDIDALLSSSGDNDDSGLM